MAAWLIENVAWLAAGVVAVLVGIKVAVARLFKRLADSSAAAADEACGDGEGDGGGGGGPSQVG